MTIHTYQARNLTVKRAKNFILNEHNFTAKSGEFTAIIGPNGSGKTTLLSALSGEISSIGEITINNHNMRKLSSTQLAHIRAVLPQISQLAFPFRVKEIVGLGVLHRTAENLENIPNKALELVDLKGFSNKFYQELSGGEQQRVQLARILCQVWEPVVSNIPRWILLDEPISSLDIHHQFIIMKIVKRFSQLGGGVIAILHDLNLTAMFADKIHVIHEGNCFDFGKPCAVLSDKLMKEVYQCKLRFGCVPKNKTPFILPQSGG